MAEDLAKTLELLKQAKQVIEANKMDEGRVLLKQAIKAAPTLDAVHQALAELCERNKNEDEMLEAYRQWTQAGPRTPMPGNRFREILERRKDYKGALEAYNQSLKIEWNQPPAAEAKSRMEKALNKSSP